MSPKFLNHCKTENLSFAGMVQDMQPYESGVEFPMKSTLGAHIQIPSQTGCSSFYQVRPKNTE